MDEFLSQGRLLDEEEEGIGTEMTSLAEPSSAQNRIEHPAAVVGETMANNVENEPNNNSHHQQQMMLSPPRELI